MHWARLRPTPFWFALLILFAIPCMGVFMERLASIRRQLLAVPRFIYASFSMETTQKTLDKMTLPSLLTISLEDIAAGIDSGDFTVYDLTKAALARIDEVNEQLHAVIQVNPDALHIAQTLDEQVAKTGERGPLFGATILVKDNVVTNEKLEATSGSAVLLGARPDRESVVASKLRKAGAVLLGTANLSEWANFRSKISNSGWTPRGNQTFGAYYPSMHPAGSSSGSAVAADVALCFAAIGTETQGSLITPAETNNVVGIKPTVGLVSRDSIIPVALDRDTVGPLARTVQDAAAILTVIAGRDSNDPMTDLIPFETIPDYRKSCTTSNFSRMRLGIPQNALEDVPESILAQFKKVTRLLMDLGAEIVDVDFPAVNTYKNLSFEEKIFVMAAEFSTSLSEYLSSLDSNPNRLHTLEDVYRATTSDPREDFPHRDLGLWDLALAANRDSEEYRAAKSREKDFAGPSGILGAMDAHRLDAIIAPCAAKIPNHFAAGGGLPMITVPLGYLPEGTPVKWNERHDTITQAPNRPYGLGITGRSFSEQTLIEVAFAIESVTKTRKDASHFVLPTTDLQDIVLARI